MVLKGCREGEHVRACVCGCMIWASVRECVSEREREKDGERVCVCVLVRERESECVCVCVCVCVSERERERERENHLKKLITPWSLRAQILTLFARNRQLFETRLCFFIFVIGSDQNRLAAIYPDLVKGKYLPRWRTDNQLVTAEHKQWLDLCTNSEVKWSLGSWFQYIARAYGGMAIQFSSVSYLVASPKASDRK